METFERKTPGIVLSAEYFPHSENSQHPLAVLFKDPEVRECVSGIWVPAHLTSHHETMDDLIKITSGKSHFEYEHKPGSHDNQYELIVPSDRILEPRPIPLIIDSCISGAAPVERIKELLRNGRAAINYLTVTVGIEEGLEEITDEFGDREDLKFFMIATYPERTPEGSLEFHGKEEDVFTHHVAELVNKYGIEGVVGYAGMAKQTLQNQRLLSMGITADGKNYDIVRKLKNGTTKRKIKRANTPEKALEGASFQPDGTCNTELLLGRAVLPEDVYTNESYKVRWESLSEQDRIEIMRANILNIRDLAAAAIRAQ